MARVACFFTFAGNFLILVMQRLFEPLALPDLPELLVGGICVASFAGLRDRDWGRAFSVLGLFTYALILSLSGVGEMGGAAAKAKGFAFLYFLLGAAVLAGDVLHRASRTERED